MAISFVNNLYVQLKIFSATDTIHWSSVLTINGKKVASSETKDVINPATEEPFAAAPIATPQHLEDAVNAASRALPSWSATPVEKRQEMLSNLGDLVARHLQQFVELLNKEVGKPKAAA
jgi:acyl-CoA reductase-like NAD-dependent aldehyde dehydrogenase